MTVNGQPSNHMTVTYGVAHGTLLGPRLFATEVNNLPTVLSIGKLEMFADDAE